MIPTELTLTRVQEAFRDIETKLNSLLLTNVNMNQRRVINAGKAVDDFDYVTKYDIDRALLALEDRDAVRSETLLNTVSSIRYGPIATRGSAVAHRFRLFVASDQGQVGWISSGAVWKYVFGIEAAALASLRGGLGSDDAGYLFEVTDYDHVLQWTGSAWTWGPGEKGSGYYQLYEDAPNSVGASAWQICDGSTVARLNADGTTTNVTVPNLATPAYLKGGTSSAAVAAASGTVADTTATNQAAGVDAHAVVERLDVAGVGIFVFDNEADAAHADHNHTQDAHNHAAGTMELRNKQARLYFRR